MAALRTAGTLANRLRGHITLIVPEVVPFHLPLNKPAVVHDWNKRRFRVLAAGCTVETSVRFLLCRDRDETLARNFSFREAINRNPVSRVAGSGSRGIRQ